jgi:hypothetical protein
MVRQTHGSLKRHAWPWLQLNMVRMALQTNSIKYVQLLGGRQAVSGRIGEQL